MTRRTLTVVPADPRVQVFANVPFGRDRNRREDAETVAFGELEKRYPSGASGLRGGYLVRRVGGSRRLLCFGFPDNAASPGVQSVAASALVPRRVLVRRRSVVIRPGPGYLTRICLEHGVPTEISVVAPDSPTSDLAPDSALRETVERGLNSVAERFSRAPRFVLYGGASARSRSSEPVVAASKQGAVAIRERRRPSLRPELRGRPAPQLGMRSVSARVVLNFAVAVILGVAAAGGHGAIGRASETEVAAQSRDRSGEPITPPAVATAADALPQVGRNAAFTLVALSRVFAAGPGEEGVDGARANGLQLHVPVRLEETRIEGARVRLWGSGVPGAAVVEALSQSGIFRDVELISESLGEWAASAAGSGGGFLVAARYTGGSPGAAGESRPLLAVVRSILEEAELAAGTMKRMEERESSGRGYRIEARGAERRIVEAVAALSGLAGELEVPFLSLSRRERGVWQLRFRVVSSTEDA